MSKESIGYHGPQLFPDSKEVIYDTPIAELSKCVQKVYLEGGYHSLVNRVLSVYGFMNNLNAEEQAFLRNRLARELIDSTANAHKDKASVSLLIGYFDHKADVSLYSKLSSEAKHLAEVYVCGGTKACDLFEKPSL